jgi:hypothetical protein
MLTNPFLPFLFGSHTVVHRLLRHWGSVYHFLKEPAKGFPRVLSDGVPKNPVFHLPKHLH